MSPADLAGMEERILIAIATASAQIVDAIRQTGQTIVDAIRQRSAEQTRAVDIGPPAANDRHVPGPTTPPGGPANDDAPALEAEAPPASEPHPIPLERLARLDAASLARVDALAAERNVTREDMLLTVAKRGLGIMEAGLSEEEWEALRAEVLGERPEGTAPPSSDRDPPSEPR